MSDCATDAKDLWADADIIHSYSRAQAIADGDLIDVTGATTREAGIDYPVAFTRAAHASCVALTKTAEQMGNSVDGRLWDVLTMYRVTVHRQRPRGSEFCFEVLCVVDEPEAELVRLKAVAGPGDDGEQVITIMLSGED